MYSVIPIKHQYLNRFVYSFLINTSNYSILIDTGMKQGREKIESLLTGIPVILCTHGHFDHIGSHRYFQKRGARVMAHPEEYPIMFNREAQWEIGFSQFSEDCAIDPNLRSVFVEANGKPVHEDVFLLDGQVLNFDDCIIEVIHTPGHTTGSICFYLPKQNILFTGDTLIGSGIFGNMPLYSDPSSYIQSMEKLQKHTAEKVYGCHDEIISNNGLKDKVKEGLDGAIRFEKIIYNYFASRKNNMVPTLIEIINLLTPLGSQAGPGICTVALGHLSNLSNQFPAAAALRNKYLHSIKTI